MPTIHPITHFFVLEHTIFSYLVFDTTPFPPGGGRGTGGDLGTLLVVVLVWYWWWSGWIVGLSFDSSWRYTSIKSVHVSASFCLYLARHAFDPGKDSPFSHRLSILVAFLDWWLYS